MRRAPILREAVATAAPSRKTAGRRRGPPLELWGPDPQARRRLGGMAVVLEDATLQFGVDIHARLILRCALDGLAIGFDLQLFVAPVDAAGPGRRHQHV